MCTYIKSKEITTQGSNWIWVRGLHYWQRKDCERLKSHWCETFQLFCDKMSKKKKEKIPEILISIDRNGIQLCSKQYCLRELILPLLVNSTGLKDVKALQSQRWCQWACHVSLSLYGADGWPRTTCGRRVWQKGPGTERVPTELEYLLGDLLHSHTTSIILPSIPSLYRITAGLERVLKITEFQAPAVGWRPPSAPGCPGLIHSPGTSRGGATTALGSARASPLFEWRISS